MPSLTGRLFSVFVRHVQLRSKFATDIVRISPILLSYFDHRHAGLDKNRDKQGVAWGALLTNCCLGNDYRFLCCPDLDRLDLVESPGACPLRGSATNTPHAQKSAVVPARPKWSPRYADVDARTKRSDARRSRKALLVMNLRCEIQPVSLICSQTWSEQTIVLLSLNLGVLALVRPIAAAPWVLKFHVPYLIACILFVVGLVGGAVALVVVGHCPTAPLFDRQSWLGTIEGLDLAFLVDAQDQGLVWRVEIKADHIVELFDKTFVATELESLGQMRFEAMSVPNTLNRHPTDALRLGHCADAPVSGASRSGVQGGLHDCSYFFLGDTRDTPWPRRVLF
jgi:hypothetical protein